MNSEHKKIICIDLDDTLCNFKKSFWKNRGKEPGIKYPQLQYKFFEKLEPIDGAIESFKLLTEHFEVFILSKPSVLNPLSYTEKRVWVEEHLGIEFCERLILSCDKTLIRCDYLIDDVKQKGVLEPQFEHIMFGSDKFPDWKSVINYLL